MRTVVVSDAQLIKGRARLWVWSLVAERPPGVDATWITHPHQREQLDGFRLSDVLLGDVVFTYQIRSSLVDEAVPSG